ncbi:MAG: dihydroorotate dehydrogenase electron transfer subunit [Ruminococcaceae bacterium]|nr:dihydroorotate dehydrogenase electron transfer subunit [Oscillospiraceae bacterium]
MKQVFYRVAENRPLARDVYWMRLEGDTTPLTRPGQFINIRVGTEYLRRPISVCDWDDRGLVIIYKVVGKGTELMSRMAAGEVLDTLSGLGNGFDISKAGEKPLLIGGGVGVPPMYSVCKRLAEVGITSTVVLGFNSAADVFYREEFEVLGAKVYVTTADGTYGEKGFVTDVMKDLDYSYFFTCGPEPMFRAVEKIAKTSGQYSFEERMGCGFGACMGCSCKTLYGNKRICVDGPVLEREEIIWEQK